jgi:hypothetical protein
VQEPNFELWRERREQVMREVQTNRLGRGLLAARQGASSRPADRRQAPRGVAPTTRESPVLNHPEHRRRSSGPYPYQARDLFSRSEFGEPGVGPCPRNRGRWTRTDW